MLPSDLNFGAPLWLWALLALPALAALFVRAEWQASQRLARLIQAPRLRQQLAGVANGFRRRLRFVLLGFGLAGLIVAAAQPRWGYETRETHRRGLDLVVVADVSKSMLATDLAPDRLTREKLAVEDLLRQLQGDRVGLVAFAGSAFLQAPLTIDYDAVRDSVAELDADLIPRGGTNLGGAIELATEAFGKNEAGNRAILLLSDGEPTTEGEQANGVEAARRAAAAGVRVYTVGFGTPEGSLIPLAGGRKGEFVRDDDGKIVRSRLDEPGLTEIAHAGSGFYVRFTTGEATMRTLVADGLSQLKAGEIDARTARRPIERYAWALAPALLCLTLGSLVGERRRRGAPAAIDGISPDAIAVPLPRTGAAAPALASTAVILTLFWVMCAVPAARAANADKTSPTAPEDNPAERAMELYRQGKFEEAYRAYEELAKKDPKANSLPYNAGTSAFMGKQYDEAMNSFAKALASGDAGLRAKAHYNFGNTLFRHGQDQKESKARVADWRNAIQHYDSTLAMLKGADPAHRDNALASNTTYNRDVVQKRLDEELKQQPQKNDKDKKDDKKDPKQDKKDQGQQGQSKGDKQDQQQQKDGGQPQQQDQNQNGSSPSKDKNGSGNQPPKPDDQQQQGKDSQSPPQSGGEPTDKDDASKGSGKNQPDQKDPSKGNGKPADSKNPADGSSDNQSHNGPPDKSDLPDQSKPRQKGDFQAQPGQPDKNNPPQKEGEAGAEEGEGKEEDGKMTAAQARALLDALKGEDARVTTDNKHRRDEPVAKDW